MERRPAGLVTEPAVAAPGLDTKLALAAPALHAVSSRLWQEPGLSQRYRRYLRAMHGVLRATVPLMELAARRCARLDRLDRPDPVAGPLRRYLVAQLAEEREHDRWLLADLAALGEELDPLLATAPPPAVARLVGPQYYWIEHFHPVALLGYIAALQTNAPHPALADRIVTGAGVPRAAVRTVRGHAGSGPGVAVLDLLDRLPLTPAQSTAVAVSALCTVDALLGVLDRVVDAPARPGGEAGHAQQSVHAGGA